MEKLNETEIQIFNKLTEKFETLKNEFPIGNDQLLKINTYSPIEIRDFIHLLILEISNLKGYPKSKLSTLDLKKGESYQIIPPKEVAKTGNLPIGEYVGPSWNNQPVFLLTSGDYYEVETNKINFIFKKIENT